MAGLFEHCTFAGFGPNRLEASDKVAICYRIDGKRPGQLRSKLRQECPRHAGVYGMLDSQGALVYVGKAKNLRARLLSYFRAGDRRARRIRSVARSICWELAADEFGALVRELELIHRWKPAFNVHGQPRRYSRLFLCLGKRPAPYLFLTRRLPKERLGTWGPVFAGPKSREAVRRLNDWFGLRDCPGPQTMIFADDAELFPVLRPAACIRHEIGTCLGPCAGLCTRAGYEDRAVAAKSFLDGHNRQPIEKLQEDMLAAAAALAYERAAALHEKLEAIQWLERHLIRLREAREKLHFIYPVKDTAGGMRWYLIHRGQVAAACAAPRTPAERREAESLIAKVYAGTWSGPKSADETDDVLLVSAWFRRHPEELKCAMPVPLACADS